MNSGELLSFLAGLCLVRLTPLWRADSVLIAFQETAGVTRSNEIAVFGVPLLRTWQVSGGQQLRLRDSQAQLIPAQFNVLGR